MSTRNRERERERKRDEDCGGVTTTSKDSRI